MFRDALVPKHLDQVWQVCPAPPGSLSMAIGQNCKTMPLWGPRYTRKRGSRKQRMNQL